MSLLVTPMCLLATPTCLLVTPTSLQYRISRRSYTATIFFADSNLFTCPGWATRAINLTHLRLLSICKCYMFNCYIVCAPCQPQPATAKQNKYTVVFLFHLRVHLHGAGQ
ncbi:hypothetical protein IQ07DRAFT_284627 [Pyrenochaeta sp. DS3sAY3a]|nr:hypothetical protein IQ07DRAFT_284627 [Pyrenochaeta sp. DS3sAY3a]